MVIYLTLLLGIFRPASGDFNTGRNTSLRQQLDAKCAALEQLATE